MPTIKLSEEDFEAISDLLTNWKEGCGNDYYEYWEAIQQRFENAE